MVVETYEVMRVPDDLMTIPQLAEALSKPYSTVNDHIKNRAGARLHRWEKRAIPYYSFAEVKAYFDAWDNFTLVEEAGQVHQVNEEETTNEST